MKIVPMKQINQYTWPFLILYKPIILDTLVMTDHVNQNW